jgi:hypothetical protein
MVKKLATGARSVKFGMEEDRRHTYTSCVEYYFDPPVTNMAQYFQVVSDRFNAARIYTNTPQK